MPCGRVSWKRASAALRSRADRGRGGHRRSPPATRPSQVSSQPWDGLWTPYFRTARLSSCLNVSRRRDRVAVHAGGRRPDPVRLFTAVLTRAEPCGAAFACTAFAAPALGTVGPPQAVRPRPDRAVRPHAGPGRRRGFPLPATHLTAARLRRGTRSRPYHADHQVVADVADVPGVPEPIRNRILEDPHGAVERISRTLQVYWELAFADVWPRVRALLEADVLWRSRRLAPGGAHALFEDLHETVTWHGDRLSATDSWHYSGSLSGEGLLLVPSAMAWPTVRRWSSRTGRRSFIPLAPSRPSGRPDNSRHRRRSSLCSDEPAPAYSLPSANRT